MTRITCPICIKRLDDLRGRHANLVYDTLGNHAAPSMGHDMYFTRNGKLALCVAQYAGTQCIPSGQFR